MGRGSEMVRAPRLRLDGEERAWVEGLVREAVGHGPRCHEPGGAWCCRALSAHWRRSTSGAGSPSSGRTREPRLRTQTWSTRSSDSSRTSSTRWASGRSRRRPRCSNYCGSCPTSGFPGTLNVGHALPTIAQALIFIAVVRSIPTTLVAMIGAAVSARGWAQESSRVCRGAPSRSAWAWRCCARPALFVLGDFEWIPAGGEALRLRGALLAFAVAGNFLLGALMTLGVGLYAPCSFSSACSA